MRVVLDTNILVSGIFFEGMLTKILKRWLEGAFEVYVTPDILDEYRRVIDRFRLSKEPAFQHDWRVLLPELCRIIPDQRSAQPISRDATDDKFVRCATNSRSDYLVTGDKDLKSLTQTFNFEIISPKDFLALLER